MPAHESCHTSVSYVACLLDKVFVRVGLKHYKSSSTFVEYTTHAGMGSSAYLMVAKREKCVVVEQAGNDAVTFGEIATECIVQSRSALMEDAQQGGPAAQAVDCDEMEQGAPQEAGEDEVEAEGEDEFIEGAGEFIE